MYLVADIGGTKMRIAGSDDLVSFKEPSIGRTPESYEEGLAHFIEAARMIAGGNPIDKVAIGFPGVISHDKRALARSEHLPQWAGHALAADIEAALSTAVFLENDTALVGLGEAVSGAGKDASIVAYVTISTGLNGVRILDGTIDRSASGFEIGGQYLSHDLSQGETLATFEELVSGDAVHRKYGIHPRDFGKDWDGWEGLAAIAAIGIHNTILHWSPERVVLGGSMFNEIGIPVSSVKTHLQGIMKKFPEIPDIVHSSLHDEGGLYGALARLR